jgi:hypothetical protein
MVSRAAAALLAVFFLALQEIKADPLQGGISVTELQQSPMAGIGIRFVPATGMVLIVDSASDAFGSLQPGDKIIRQDGLTPRKYWKKGLNFGPVGTAVMIEYRNQQGLQSVTCRRKPISEFKQLCQGASWNKKAIAAIGSDGESGM